MEENTLGNIMVDPSLIIASRTIDKTFDLIREFYATKEFKFYLPKTFQLLVYEEMLYPESPTSKFFQQNAHPAELSSIKTLLKEHSNMIVPFEGAPEHKEKYRVFFKSLLEDRPFWRGYLHKPTSNILFEEWVFLQEYSSVVSRIKGTFNRFIDAGGVCLQFGEKTFETLVRRTLKKKDEELIAKVDKLRAFGKWVAVGGPTVLSFFNPDALDFGLISAYFLLFDPDATADKRGYALRYAHPNCLRRLR